jgi:deoxycytidylate deaminase
VSSEIEEEDEAAKIFGRSINYLKFPELIFGISGPIGIDIEAIIKSLSEVLTSVGYKSASIKITDEIKVIDSGIKAPVHGNFYTTMKYKMDHASAICRKTGDPSILMKLAVNAIGIQRQKFLEDFSDHGTPDDLEQSALPELPDDHDLSFTSLMIEGEEVAMRKAYIIRQLKRPEEVKALRSVYGAQFILISAYGSPQDRAKILEEKIRAGASISAKRSREKYFAEKLIELDMDEDQDIYGQHLRDTFHLADVIIDGISKPNMITDLKRFINALFGLNEVAPTKAEYGMNAAANAALRSSDLSRQVGAVIFARTGEIVSQGCNEVPKAFGGTYWYGEEPDFRDIKLGQDSNDILKMDVLKDLIDRLRANGLLSSKADKGSSTQIAEFLVGIKKGLDEEEDKLGGVLRNAKILDLTEFGRVVHAEMSAICDAARIGVSIRSAILYCTTFPCHNCTKHILASGINEVVFLEPYPKSKAKDLFDNEIAIEGSETGKVSFRAFLGITPVRYQSIFSKRKRKIDGFAVRWNFGGPAPMVDVASPDYLRLENYSKISANEVVFLS